ncbi:MAG: N-acetylmuramoyl-L-alanine amidase [Candidatus Fimenecus sp.]
MHKIQLFKLGAAGFILAFCLLFYTYVYRSAQTANAPVQTKETVVIIDAGHGGEDGGAVAADGTVEQLLNLQIAQYLEAQLQVFGIETVMTRTTEDSIHSAEADTTRERKVSDIHNRMKIMEETENAVFVSIHQNKYESSTQWGTQVFYSPNTTSSAALADCIQKTVVSTLQPDNKRVIKKSGSSIYLLYYAKKTAVLVECGFLSNPQETAKLKDENYQKQMAFSIALGILEYMNS